MKYIYFQRIRLLKNKIAAELRLNTNIQRGKELIESVTNPEVDRKSVV